MKCIRCGRDLKHPVYKNGQPYGYICATKIEEKPTFYYVEEINELRQEVRQLRMELQQLKANIGTLPIAPPTGPDNGNELNKPPKLIPFGKNYGKNHQELMSELKEVLKNRN